MAELPLTPDAPAPVPIQAPTRREMVSSAALTVVIAASGGLIATILIGAVLVFVDIANTDPTADGTTQTGLPPAVAMVAFVVVMTVVWAVACRLGLGAPGDAIMGLASLGTDGAPIGRGRTRVRAAAYVVVFVAVVLLGRAGLAALLVLALWAPALVRSDRRSAVDLALGVVPRSSAPRRDATPHPWAR
jgi:hypothetical protein